MMEFVTAYGQKKRVRLECNGKSLTQQSAKTECDINFIVGRFKQTGVLQHARETLGQYGDFTGMDFQEAMHVVIKGQQAFEALPAKLRNRFNNDPALFLDFCADPENSEEMVKLGLKVAPEAPEAPAAPSAAPTPPEAPPAAGK